MVQFDIYKWYIQSLRYVKFISGPIEAELFSTNRKSEKLNYEIKQDFETKSVVSIRNQWPTNCNEQLEDIGSTLRNRTIHSTPKTRYRFSKNDQLPNEKLFKCLTAIRVYFLATLLIKISLHTFVIRSNVNRLSWAEPLLSNPFGCYKNTSMYNNANFVLIVLHSFIFCQSSWNVVKRNRQYRARSSNSVDVSMEKLLIAYLSCLRVATWTEYRCLAEASFMRFRDRLNGINLREKNIGIDCIEYNVDDSEGFNSNRAIMASGHETNLDLLYKYNLIDFNYNFEYYSQKLIESDWETRETIESCRWILPQKHHSIYKENFHIPMPFHRMDLDHLTVSAYVFVHSIAWNFLIYIFIQILTVFLELDLIQRTKPQYVNLSYFDLKLFVQLFTLPHITRLLDIFMISINHVTHHVELTYAYLSCWVFHSRICKFVYYIDDIIRQIELFELRLMPDWQLENNEALLLVKVKNLQQRVQHLMKLMNVLNCEFMDIKIKHSKISTVLIVTNIVSIPSIMAIFVKNDYYYMCEFSMPISMFFSFIVPFGFICITNASIETKVSS